jgi:hypothetical protein
MTFLACYMGGSHHELLQRRRNTQPWKAEPVHDLGAELAAAMGPQLVGSVQDLKETMGATWLEELLANGRGIWTKSHDQWIWLKLDATQSIERIIRAIETLVEQRQSKLIASPWWKSQIESARSSRRKRGHPQDWQSWARYLQVWDLRKKHPSWTWARIGRAVYRKKGPYADASHFEKHAQIAFERATKMIQAAESGHWPPPIK